MEMRPNPDTMLSFVGAAGLKISRGETESELEFRLSTCAPSVPSETARTMYRYVLPNLKFLSTYSVPFPFELRPCDRRYNPVG